MSGMIVEDGPVMDRQTAWWFSHGLTAAAFVLAGWALVWPHPYVLAVIVCCLAPFAAALAVPLSGGAIALSTTRSNPRPTSLTLAVLPPLAVLIHILNSAEFLGWTVLAIAAGLGAAALGLALTSIVPGARSNGLAWLGFAALGAVSGVALFAGLDVAADSAAPRAFPAAVLDRYETHGRSTSYHLRLAPWGPRQTAQAVTVGSRLYGRVQIGDQVCVLLHPGALGEPWFNVSACGA